MMLLTKSLSLTLAFSLAAAPLVTVIHGTSENDDFDGTEASDIFVLGDGNDTARGRGGDDIFFGGAGLDFFVGAEGDDLVFGGDGPDLLRPLGGNDLMFGGRDDDTLDHYAEMIFAPVPCFEALDDYDVSYGGPGDDTLRWASGLVNGPEGFPFQPCVVSGDGYSNGGRGHDTVFVGVGSFAGASTDYVIEPAAWWGGSVRLRSLTTGATLNLRGYEVVEFSDISVML